MKKLLSLILAFIIGLLCLTGCDSIDNNIGKHNVKKLVDLEQYSAMTVDGTTQIEVVYDYIKGEFTTYEFVIENKETIAKIMSELFNMELNNYPDDRDIDIYQRWIVVKQGDNSYHIDLTLASDGEKQYICQAQKVRDIIEKYIEDNLLNTANNANKKLIDLDQYHDMTVDGTTQIEVVYDYIKGEFTTYEFAIEDQETIGKIMAEVFNMELKDYPNDRDLNIYQRWIVIRQGDNRYHIDLTLVSDGEKQYICQSQNLREIIETYIEGNLIEQGS